MNKISITGRLAADSEVRFMANGDPILQFRVADDVGYGEKKTTNWWSCSLFGKRGEALSQYLTKGQQVTVWGTAQMREWTNKDGIKQISPDIRVDEIALMGGKPEGQPAKPSGKNDYAATKGGANFADDPIPF